MSNDQMSTKPTIETVLERINEWGEQSKKEFTELRLTIAELSKGQDELRGTVAELSKGQEELRADLNASMFTVARKIEALNDNILTIQANMRNMAAYIGRLESGLLAPK